MKEESAETAAETLLPERSISPHPNLVTETDQKTLETQLAEARAAFKLANLANAVEDINEKRRQLAGPSLDIRYLVGRLRTAQVMTPSTSTGTAAFGSTVKFSHDDGRVQTHRIVGEDEADPKTGTISYISPAARLLLDKSRDGVVSLNGQKLEIVSNG